MKEDKQHAWIEKGYELVAQHGFNHLAVEVIARAMQKSKSSFYHYFGEMEVFKEALLAYHLQRAQLFTQDVSACTNVQPELIQVLLAYQIDVFFHKQLHIHRAESIYKNCIDRVFELNETSLTHKWIEYFDLHHKRLFARTFHRFITEHFCLLITQESYTATWITQYLQELTTMLLQLKAGDPS